MAVNMVIKIKLLIVYIFER